MKKLLFTLMLVLVAPAHARDLDSDKEYRTLSPVLGPEMVKLLAEINSSKFAPQLFNFAWTTTIPELKTLGFECGINPKSQHNVCWHQGYKLLPNSSEIKIDHILTFWFGNANENCAGKLMRIVYDEVIHDDLLFGLDLATHKLALDRYEGILKGIRTKYKDHKYAQKRKFSVANDFDFLYWLGDKIEVSGLEVEDGYNLTVNYRAQCQVDARHGAGRFVGYKGERFD